MNLNSVLDYDYQPLQCNWISSTTSPPWLQQQLSGTAMVATATPTFSSTSGVARDSYPFHFIAMVCRLSWILHVFLYAILHISIRSFPLTVMLGTGVQGRLLRAHLLECRMSSLVTSRQRPWGVRPFLIVSLVSTVLSRASCPFRRAGLSCGSVS